MDDKKNKILRLLEQNSRISINAICKKLFISRSSAYALLNKLKSDGTIRKFTIERGDGNQSAAIKAYISLGIDTSRAHTILHEIWEIPGVKRCELLFGDLDILIALEVSDVSALDRARVSLHQAKGVTSVNTYIVQRDVDVTNLESTISEFIKKR